ncbi:MAG: cysteine--tRNA ligase, partial [Gammaproteobacteria bacterium]
MKIFNSQTSSKEKFKPLKKGKINMYVCGMTIYDYCHIGHARTFFSFDVMVNFFKYLNYEVNYVRNITDIDDKIIQKAKEEEVPFSLITDKFIKAMNDDFKALNIQPPSIEPKVSEHIEDILEMIENLESNNFAYSGENSDVYFDIEKFPDYGKLSNRVQEDLDSGSRVEIDKNKKNPNDFVLWKKTSEEPTWDSKWGRGRPGWHIECSAMSNKYLGNNFDIHGGGLDLKFPHHENEIAQSECANDSDFANYWIHVAPLNVDGKKMSKSLGNYLTIRDLLNDYHPEVLKTFFLLTHYRKPINFTASSINEAKNILDKLYESLKDAKKFDSSKVDRKKIESFKEALEDDFNTSKALKILQKISQDLNSTRENKGAKEILSNTLK